MKLQDQQRREHNQVTASYRYPDVMTTTFPIISLLLGSHASCKAPFSPLLGQNVAIGGGQSFLLSDAGQQRLFLSLDLVTIDLRK